jgi:hypothetical protein
MVSSLKAIGRMKDARRLFERLLKLQNDVGLLSEEYDIARKRQVGNFPQAFSHISLVNAAFDLQDGPQVRSRAHRNGHKKAAKSGQGKQESKPGNHGTAAKKRAPRKDPRA